jgi:FtsP/CotA-like multicopper oxidase with cupredoxin domain
LFGTVVKIKFIQQQQIQGTGPSWTCWAGDVCGMQIDHKTGFNVLFVNALTDEPTIIHPHGLLPPIGEDGTLVCTFCIRDISLGHSLGLALFVYFIESINGLCFV